MLPMLLSGGPQQRRSRGDSPAPRITHIPAPVTVVLTLCSPPLASGISHLSDCKQLTENDVKRLCDKVRRRLASDLRWTTH
jgi:hypothetical protein